MSLSSRLVVLLLLAHASMLVSSQCTETSKPYGNPSCPTCPVRPEDCVASCPARKYPDASKTCQTCSSTCGNCASATACTSCPVPPQGQLDQTTFLSAGTCVLARNCPAGTFANTADRTCSSCASSCKTCASANACSSCVDNMFLDMTMATCLAECPAGTYTKEAACLRCPDSCASCTFQNNKVLCQTCQTGKFLIDDRCATSCPTYGFYPSGQVCKSCLSNCNTCSNSKSCQQCAQNYNLLDDETACVTQCPDGFTSANYKCVASTAPANPSGGSSGTSESGTVVGALVKVRLLADVKTASTASFKRAFIEAISAALVIDSSRIVISEISSSTSSQSSSSSSAAVLISVSSQLTDAANSTAILSIVILDQTTPGDARTSKSLAIALTGYASSSNSILYSRVMTATQIRIDVGYTSPSPVLVAKCYDNSYAEQCPFPPSELTGTTLFVVVAICVIIVATLVVLLMWNKYINISAPLPPPSPSSEVASSESAWHQNSLYAPVSELVYDDEEEFESNHASRISSKKSTNSFSTFAPATQSK